MEQSHQAPSDNTYFQ